MPPYTFSCVDFKVEVRHIGTKREPHIRWAIGVLDYWVEGAEQGFIDRFCKKSFSAFLLSFNENASPDARWKKEMTQEVIKIQPTEHVRDQLTMLYLQ